MPRKRRKSLDNTCATDLDEDFFLDDNSSSRSSCEPLHRNAANARERARMRVLSKAFCRLKTTLPWVPADTKLSKLDTLRLASSYIAHLKSILSEGSQDQMLPHPLNLAWPFSLQHGGSSINSSVTPRWSPLPPTCEPLDHNIRDYNYRDHKCYQESDKMELDRSNEYSYGYREQYY